MNIYVEKNKIIMTAQSDEECDLLNMIVRNPLGWYVVDKGRSRGLKLLLQDWELQVEEAKGGDVKVKATPAICPVCGEPVENAFYVDGKLKRIPENTIICSDNGVAYHLRPGKDCWGKHVGHPTWEEAEG